MKQKIFASALLFCILFNAKGQIEKDTPVFDFNFEFLVTNQFLDSVIQYSYSSNDQDSTRMKKWDYLYNDENNSYVTFKSSWRPDSSNWFIRNKYEYSFTSGGKPLLELHYDRRLSSGEWIWAGCSSEGCGKKEWYYDSHDNQILKTQSYWITNRGEWEIDERWDNAYDENSNMVLSSHLSRPFGNWTGSKDEFSYDQSGNMTGKIDFVWVRSRVDWFPSRKHEWNYDLNGNKTMTAFYQWDDKWVGYTSTYNYFTKMEWSLDLNGNWSSVKAYHWNSGSYDWSLDFQADTCIYYDGGQIKSEITFANQANTHFHNPLFRSYEYDNEGNRISEVISTYDDQTNSWTIATIFNHSYDSAGNRMLSEKYTWNEDSTAWQKVSKTEFSYGDYHNQTVVAEFTWDEASEVWAGVEKVEYAFDENSHLILEADYVWDNNRNDWKGYLGNWWNEQPHKFEYAYDNDGNQTLFASYQWNEDLYDWEGLRNGKTEWRYDNEGRLSEEMRYDRDSEKNNWKEISRSKTIFNEFGDPALSIQYAWDEIITDWNPIIRYLYYYRSNSSGIENVDNEEILISPNPTDGIINLSGLSELASIKVFSMEGKLFKNFSQKTNSIDISDLPTGVYILNISVEDTLIKKTIIKM